MTAAVGGKQTTPLASNHTEREHIVDVMTPPTPTVTQKVRRRHRVVSMAFSLLQASESYRKPSSPLDRALTSNRERRMSSSG